MDKDFEYKQKMEEMGDAELSRRIRESMELENEYPIRVIPYAGGVSQVVTYESEELIARCPVTAYPDFYSVRLTFVPGENLPELKSLKLYYFGFADLPISHEHLAARIYTEFCEAVKPVACRLKLTAGIRGGIKTTILVGERDI